MAQRTNGKARLGIQVFLGQPPLGSLLCQAADGPISHTLAWKEGKEGAELPVKLRVQGKFPSPRAVLGAVFEPLLLSLTSPTPAGHPHLPQSLLRVVVFLRKPQTSSPPPRSIHAARDLAYLWMWSLLRHCHLFAQQLVKVRAAHLESFPLSPCSPACCWAHPIESMLFSGAETGFL